MSAPHRPDARALSRRSVLRGGAVAAAAATPVFSGWATPAATAATLPLVTPKWSQAAVNGFGVNAMAMFDKTAYHYRSAWVANLASLGVRYIRSIYAPGFAPTYETTRLLRSHGMKWGMIGVDEYELSAPDAKVTARVNDIAARAADVCLFVEGINEPNHNRDGSPVPSNWKQLTLQKQRVLWQAVQARPELRGRVAVLGPSFQMNHISDADYQWFAANGLLNYMTHAASHCYSGGRYPDRKYSTQLAPIRKYWRKPIWITETGYTNSLAGPVGPAPVPEWVAGVYAPSTVLEAIDHGHRVTWFEALDDPDYGSKSETEANYGLYALYDNRMAPPWRPKPAAHALRTLLTSLRDPGPVYRPAPIGLRVRAPVTDVRWTALGKRDGSVRLYLRRAAEVYDARARHSIAVPDVTVTIETAKGTRTVSVGARVVPVLL